VANGGNAKVAGCKAKAKDLAFKAKVKVNILALWPRLRPRLNVTAWSGNL